MTIKFLKKKYRTNLHPYTQNNLLILFVSLINHSENKGNSVCCQVGIKNY